MQPGPDADLVYLSHMIECINRVFEYCEGGESSFRQSCLIQDAVIRNLQTMAESSQRLSESTKAIAPDVPWRAISGFRNIIVHDYLGVDLDMVWQVVSSDLPLLQAALLKINANPI
ncbi:DUF86 domain-containing protein [Polaromonas sp. CG_23.6]|uniref:HepT-like ribonuclease domain-containing protein n=1 Tax=Polaromonas sp. CG_23.6 TaxID=2760709 RepID=UPI0024753A50|nr:DUF86 domain-containing protein [Polaromonas sp. CG_23.6]MDH6185989.1 uncharacterized protein with HEPN domain [Polaromonas sp. CG_23.6]